jgi:secondary thiamine-phosphate synthase enzyme
MGPLTCGPMHSSIPCRSRYAERMPVVQKAFRIQTKGSCDTRDITPQVQRVVSESGIRLGTVNVSGLGSTLGITTIEFEPGAVSDLERALEQVAPSNDNYAHNARWGDHNGFAHLRSALMGTAATLPVSEGSVHLGTWQQIILCDFDDRPRDREVTVTVIGE